MFNLLKAIIRKLQPQTVVEAHADFERTHEIMSGDTVMFWDNQLDSMEVGEFNYLLEWVTGTESPYAIVTRWDGEVLQVLHELIELF